jgi:hypothetical protein
MGDHVIHKNATPAPLPFLMPSALRALELLMSLNESGKRTSIGDASYTPYAFVTFDQKRGMWRGVRSLSGPGGKAKTKLFASDKAAAEYMAEEALRVRYVHCPRLLLMSPYCNHDWVRCLKSSFPNLPFVD